MRPEVGTFMWILDTHTFIRARAYQQFRLNFQWHYSYTLWYVAGRIGALCLLMAPSMTSVMGTIHPTTWIFITLFFLDLSSRFRATAVSGTHATKISSSFIILCGSDGKDFVYHACGHEFEFSTSPMTLVKWISSMATWVGALYL